MAMADDEERSDLSVRLEWPDDPLTAAPITLTPPEDPAEVMAARVAALEEIVASATGRSDDIATAMKELATRLDAVTDVVDVLRSMNDNVRRIADEHVATLDNRLDEFRAALMTLLSSHAADEKRVLRKDRENVIKSIDEHLTSIQRTVTEAVAATRTQSDVFADRVAAELQALRRRIPVNSRGPSSAIDDATMDELVTRVADEVEIRLAAALKPKPKRR